jgi:hypothetical protein
MGRGDWARERWVDASVAARQDGLDWAVYVSEGVIDVCAPPEVAPGAAPREVPAAQRAAWLRNVRMVVRGLVVALRDAKPGPFFCCTAWWAEGHAPARAHGMLYDVLRDGAARRYCIRPAYELLADDPRRPPAPGPRPGGGPGRGSA